MMKFELYLMAILVGILVFLLTLLFRAAPLSPPPAPPCTGATIAGRECVVCTQVGGYSVTAIDCR